MSKRKKNFKIKRIWLWLVMIILLLLDWVALDDITTGNEPNSTGEYAILIFSLIVFVFLWVIVRKKKII